MRKSTIYLTITTSGLMLLGLLGMHCFSAQAQGKARRALNGSLVRDLQLTDLCLVTEARYTRHPAMADLHAPFQDHPTALEHFPSGALLSPPVFPSPHVQIP